MMSKKYIFISLAPLLVMGIVGRIIPHTANVTPITAIALFITAYFGVRYSIPAIIGIMVISNLFIGSYSLPIMLAVYGSLIVASLLGVYLQRNKTISSTFIVTISSSLIFFLITNWAVWQFGTMYQHSISGLMQSYMMGIPFFKNSLMGDIFYTSLLFATPSIVNIWSFRSKKTKNKISCYGNVII